MAQSTPKGTAGKKRQLLWQAVPECGGPWGALLQGGWKRTNGRPLWLGRGRVDRPKEVTAYNRGRMGHNGPPPSRPRSTWTNR